MSRIQEPIGGSGDNSALFAPGEVIHHKRFDYRGVIIDVDPVFQLSEEWYEQVARSRPPKDEPWYHVLVHEATHVTYVAQRHLEPDALGAPIRHPLLADYFDTFVDGHYERRQRPN